MSKYSVLWVADEENRRDYRARQLYANAKGAICFIEGHHNANMYSVDINGDGVADVDAPGVADNPTSVLVCDNASAKSMDMGTYFAAECAKAFKIPNRGLVVRKPGERGYYNLYYTNMPAVLLEPLYVSDAEVAVIAQSEHARDTIAQLIANMVRKYFPNGGVVAFSVGHLFKLSSKWDRGAPVVGTGGKVAEGDLVLEYMRKAAELLLTGKNIGDAPEEVQLEPLEGGGGLVKLVGLWEVVEQKDGVTTIRQSAA